MKVDNQLKEYLCSIYNKKEIIDILYKNSLFGLLGSAFVSFSNDDLKVLKKKRIDVRYLENALRKLCILMDKNQIEYFAFKGVVIANQLYGNNNCRQLSDIDLFVPQYDFDRAITILENEGFILKSKEELKNQHHVVLISQPVVIELHRNILTPLIKIDESYLHKNIITLDLFGYKIKTFDTTVTLVHLIYHLYMDTYLVSGNMYSLMTTKKYPQARRFLYRAYEISLFSEKYFNEIKWEDIERDVKSQKLRIIFKKMIFDILRIFPSAFPKSFVDTVRKIDYVEDERDKLYKYLIDIDINDSDDFDALISKFIDDNWDARKKKNICKKVGETISLTNKLLRDKQDLNCVIDTEKNTKGLKIVFKVSNDDFYISETGNYDTQTSDGVHLLLCGTEQYSYNSIFFFPKQIDGKIRVVVCDVLNNRNIVSDNLIKTEFSKADKDYTITAMLSNEFLKENNLNSYLYMGLVISDCSSETHRRKNQLILSEEDSQWYNPVYFAKIIM